MQSGTSLNLWALTRNPKNTAVAIGRAFSIDTDNTTVLINKLRKIDTDALQKVSVSDDFVVSVYPYYSINMTMTWRRNLYDSSVPANIARFWLLGNHFG